MDIQELAYRAGASRSNLADEMKRRSLMRQLDRVPPGALDAIMNGGASAGGGGGQRFQNDKGFNPGGGNYGMTPVPDIDRDADAMRQMAMNQMGARNAMQAQQDEFARAALRQKTADMDQAARDERIDSIGAGRREDTARQMADVYGAATGGAYGHGITTPGGSEDEQYMKALGLRMAGGRGTTRVTGNSDFAKMADERQKYMAAQAYHDALVAKGEDATQAALALDKAKANFQAAEVLYGGAAQAAPAESAPTSKYASWIPPTDQEVAFGGNTPAVFNAVQRRMQRAGMIPAAAPAPASGAVLTEMVPSHGAPGALADPAAAGALPAPAAPLTKVVNGATYRKVAGGWELVG